MDKRFYEEIPPLKSWQFFHAARKILGDAFLIKLYSRGKRQIYRWAADPDFTTDHERNPIDRLRVLLSRLCEVGREDVALSGVSMLAEVVGCELKKIEGAEPDGESLEAECLDDYPALTSFHNAIREGDPPEVVRHLWQEAKKELDETWERYRQELER